MSTKCKILDTKAFADGYVVQHVCCSYRVGMEENVPPEVSVLLVLLLLRHIAICGLPRSTVFFHIIL
jgi:hypothetical protein